MQQHPPNAASVTDCSLSFMILFIVVLLMVPTYGLMVLAGAASVEAGGLGLLA